MKLPYQRYAAPFEQRRQNIRQTLLAVHLFGHLRHAELARLVWPHSTPQGRAANASNLFAYLVKEGYLLKRVNSLGSYSYVLGLRGAMFVGHLLPEGSREGSKISGVQGRTLFHRTLGTAWMIEQLLAGHDVLPEFAINSNRYPIKRPGLVQHWGKLPDGLILHEMKDDRGNVTHYNVDWLEVESTHKGQKERGRIMDMAWALGKPLLPDTPYYLDRLILLYTDDSSHETALVQSAGVKWREMGHHVEDPQALLGSVMLTTATVAPPLSVKSFKSIDLYTYMHRTEQLKALFEGAASGDIQPTYSTDEESYDD